jgi:hypothetical protein
MDSAGFFTNSDLVTIRRAALLAQRLTEKYFCLAESYWKLNPYQILTRKQVNKWFYEPDAFASVVRYGTAGDVAARPLPKDQSYGIVLQDPNILRALLRSTRHDLWTFGLFILTHELVHVVRFTKFDVDFWAESDKRRAEENLVREITGRMLAGVTNTDYLLNLYEEEIETGEKTAAEAK